MGQRGVLFPPPGPHSWLLAPCERETPTETQRVTPNKSKNLYWYRDDESRNSLKGRRCWNGKKCKTIWDERLFWGPAAISVSGLWNEYIQLYRFVHSDPNLYKLDSKWKFNYILSRTCLLSAAYEQLINEKTIILKLYFGSLFAIAKLPTGRNLLGFLPCVGAALKINKNVL